MPFIPTSLSYMASGLSIGLAAHFIIIGQPTPSLLMVVVALFNFLIGHAQNDR